MYVGSAVVLLLDTEQLQDAASVISTLGTLDNFVAELLQANFFSAVIERSVDSREVLLMKF